MQTAEIFGIAKKDLHIVVKTEDIRGHYCEFGGKGVKTFGGFVTLNMLEGILEFEYVYFHVIFGIGNEKASVAVDTIVKWEYALNSVKDLLHFHRTGEVIELKLTEKPKEEDEMFRNYVIQEVEFGELNIVAIKASLKEIAKSMPGVSLEKEGSDTYLVKDGTAVKLDSKEFQDQVKAYVVGKTMAELQKNQAMYNLITKLGLITKCTLTKAESGFAGIFGE